MLEVDNRAPYNPFVRAITSYADLLHSWVLPSLGIKVDGRPGQAPFLLPTSILHTRGRSDTPSTPFTVDWVDLEHEEVQQASPRMEWFVASVPCKNFEGYGQQQEICWTTYPVRSSPEDAVFAFRGCCLTYLCSETSLK